MPVINNTRSNGSMMVSELVDSVGTAGRTFTFPDANTRDTLEVFNIGDKDLVVSVGTQSNVTINAFKSQKFSESFTGFTIQSTSGHASFRARASYPCQDEVDEDRLATQLIQKVDLATLSESGRNIKVVACTLRNDGTGWKFIGAENGDVNHSHINVSSVTATTSYLTLNFSFTAKNILSFVACPDETFAQAGYYIGSSVGTNYAQIYMSQETGNVGGYIYYDGTTWQTTYSSGISSVSFSGGILTVTHNAVGGYMVNATSRDGAYNTAIGSVTNTTSQIKFLNPSGTLITTPDTNMKVYFTKVPVGTGIGTLNPQNVSIAGSNIWCLGVFEV